MALLYYGLPQVRSVCFRAEKVGWMANSKIRSSLSAKLSAEISSIQCNKRAMPYNKLLLNFFKKRDYTLKQSLSYLVFVL